MRSKRHGGHIMLMVVIIGLLAAVSIPSLVKALSTSQKKAGIHALGQTGGASSALDQFGPQARKFQNVVAP